jgi:hypothetical protein
MGIYAPWGWRFMTLTEDNDNVPLVPLKNSARKGGSTRRDFGEEDLEQLYPVF